MLVEKIICFRNDKNILLDKTRSKGKVRNIGYVLGIWHLVKIDNKFIWQVYSRVGNIKSCFILNFEKRRLAAKKYSKKIGVKVIYKHPSKDLLTNYTVRFNPKDLK